MIVSDRTWHFRRSLLHWNLHETMLKCFNALQVKWLKLELSRALVECRAANLRCLFFTCFKNKDAHFTISLYLFSLLIVIRAEELETAFMELVKEDNRRSLTAKVDRFFGLCLCFSLQKCGQIWKVLTHYQGNLHLIEFNWRGKISFEFFHVLRSFFYSSVPWFTFCAFIHVSSAGGTYLLF